jgi:hypothetical protein
MNEGYCLQVYFSGRLTLRLSAYATLVWLVPPELRGARGDACNRHFTSTEKARFRTVAATARRHSFEGKCKITRVTLETQHAANFQNPAYLECSPQLNCKEEYGRHCSWQRLVLSAWTTGRNTTLPTNLRSQARFRSSWDRRLWRSFLHGWAGTNTGVSRSTSYS